MSVWDELQEVGSGCVDGDTLPSLESRIAALQFRLSRLEKERDAAVARVKATEGLVTAAEAVLHDYGRFERKAFVLPDLGRVELWSPERGFVKTSSMNDLQQALLLLVQKVPKG